MPSFWIPHGQHQVIRQGERPALAKLRAGCSGIGGKRIPDHVLDTDAGGRQGGAEQTQMIGAPSRLGDVLEAVEQVVENEIVGAWRGGFQELLGRHSIKTDAGEFYL